VRLSLALPARTTAGSVLAAGVLVGGFVTPVPAGAATFTPSATVHHVAATGQRHESTRHRVMNHKLRRLRHCESGGRYHINTGNGYYGAYQFAKSTWHGLGYHGLPSNATKRKQDTAAKRLHAQQGWHPWPVCSKKEHL
jgi:hypothetical protein